MQHRIDARGDGIAAVALEPFEIFAVARQRLRRVVMREVRGLLDQRLLQRQQLGQLAGGGFPHRRRRTVVAVLLEQ